MIATLALWALATQTVSAPDPALDRVFADYFGAKNAKDAGKVVERIVALKPPFPEVYSRLSEGRPYSSAETGEMRWVTLPVGGAQYATTIAVPANYNPTLKYPVRVFLHGGVARPGPRSEDDGALGVSEGGGPGGLSRPRPRRRLDTPRTQIEVYPAGFAEAQWWFSNQVTNVEDILDRLKRTYNVDENRVHLVGVSDGGTGTYFFGLRHATPFSVFFPFNGSLRVLSNPATNADGEFFMTNLTNKPSYVINGLNDPLYPATAAVPYLSLLKQAGATIEFRSQNAAHDTSWWPTERERVESFEEDHPRDPLPEKISWQTDNVDRYNRFHWLVIDRLDTAKASSLSSSDLNAFNTIERVIPQDFGLRVDSSRGDGRRVVDVTKESNAEGMGLKKGDLIMEINGERILTAGDIGRAFESHTPGQQMKFMIDRKGARMPMQAEFPPKPKPIVQEEAFKHSRTSGRVDLVRAGNVVTAKTMGVASFTLLLSPDAFDFSKPVRVIVNGKTAFEGAVTTSIETMLRWNARDNDRTMLFGAELKIEVPAK